MHGLLCSRVTFNASTLINTGILIKQMIMKFMITRTTELLKAARKQITL